MKKELYCHVPGLLCTIPSQTLTHVPGNTWGNFTADATLAMYVGVHRSLMSGHEYYTYYFVACEPMLGTIFAIKTFRSLQQILREVIS